jgi:hypothetical protein
MPSNQPTNEHQIVDHAMWRGIAGNYRLKNMRVAKLAPAPDGPL